MDLILYLSTSILNATLCHHWTNSLWVHSSFNKQFGTEYRHISKVKRRIELEDINIWNSKQQYQQQQQQQLLVLLLL